MPGLQGAHGHARVDGLIEIEQVLAVDVGGTKIAAGVVSDDGRLLRTAMRPTPRGTDADEVFAALTAAVAEVDPAGCLAVGVGSGGPMTPGGASISPLNIPGWRGFPLLSRLEQEYALPVVVDNDAKALALGEAWRGAGAGVRDFLAMVVSTGVGGGLVVDGRLLDGASGNAGHVGHVVVVPDGAVCGCGARGCLEAEISGTGLARRLGHPAIGAGADEVERAGRLLGLGLASVVSLLDLSVVLVGGSVALGFGAPFFTAANASLREHGQLDYTRGCTVQPVGLGAEGPLIGAGALGWRRLGRDVGVR